MRNRFQNKTCVVTGASGGIGEAVVSQITSEGGHVVAVDITRSKNHDINHVNVAVFSQVINFVNRIKKIEIHNLINCAGVMSPESMLINFEGSVNMCETLYPYLAENGSVVNISSIHTYRTLPQNRYYAASKAAIEAYSRGLSQRGSIRVNCVAPGAVDTPMLRSNPDFNESWIVSQPEEIAEVICFLASDESRAINGTTIVADRGVMAKL